MNRRSLLMGIITSAGDHVLLSSNARIEDWPWRAIEKRA